jgi:NitT/TauT family transport system permease protein
VNQPLFRKIWGGATGWLDRPRKMGWTDLIFLLVVVALAMGIFNAAQEWGAPRDPRIEPTIDLSPWYLPLYTFYSLMRGLIAYALSLLFTLVYGYWAAKDRVAQRVLVPLLDILQSIPVLGFAPSLILVFVALFPHNNVGLEVAAIIAIFTGQAWNMTFSFYQSVRSVPADMQEAATVYRFSWWQRFRWVELPFSTIGLIWNSMMSMAGGWFFLATVEGLEFGGKKYWLPGIGSYIHAASTGDHWNWQAIGLGVLSMVLMIVALDQLLWRPVVAWAKKFRVEEGGEQEEATSWFLDWLRRSRLIGFLGASIGGLFHRRERQVEKAAEIAPTSVDPTQQSSAVIWLSRGLFFVLTGVLIYGAWQLVRLVMAFGEPGDWAVLLLDAFRTLGRVLIAVAVGTIWTVPVGLAIGLSARLSRHLQSVVQVLASFPSPLLFPLVILSLQAASKAWGGRENDPTVLEWGSILLMLLGTQWYILFNVIAGAMAIPADLKEAARSYNITGWQRFWVLYFPALFPYLVTGWVTAAGGAWNASILAEWDHDSSGLVAHGLGADIMEAAAGWKHPGQEPTAAAASPSGDETQAAAGKEAPPPANFPMLAAAVLIMSTVVVLFNRAVWRQLYALAEKRFSITR